MGFWLVEQICPGPMCSAYVRLQAERCHGYRGLAWTLERRATCGSWPTNILPRRRKSRRQAQRQHRSETSPRRSSHPLHKTIHHLLFARFGERDGQRVGVDRGR